MTALHSCVGSRRGPADGRAVFRYVLSGVPLYCDIYWEREEPRTRDEPGQAAQATLESADCCGVNIYELLSDDQRAEIESAFLSQES